MSNSDHIEAMRPYIRQRLIDEQNKPEPTQAAEDEQGLGMDAVDAFQRGALQGIAGIGETSEQLFGVGEGVRDWANDSADEQLNQMSSLGRESLQKPIFESSESGGVQFGEGATDPRTWVLNLSQVAGQYVDMFAGAGAIKLGVQVGAKVVFKASAKKAIKNGANKEVAEGLAQKATKEYLGSMSSKVNVGSFTALGAAMAGGMAGIEVRDEIMEMGDDFLDDSESFSDLFYTQYDDYINSAKLDSDGNPIVSNDQIKAFRNNARKQLAEIAATNVQADPKLILSNTLTELIGGKFLDKIASGVGTSSRLSNSAEGFLTEGITESFQGGMEKLAGNDAVLEQVDDGRSRWEDVASNALNEGVLGGAVSGAIGSVRKGSAKESIGMLDGIDTNEGVSLDDIARGEERVFEELSETDQQIIRAMEASRNEEAAALPDNSSDAINIPAENINQIRGNKNNGIDGPATVSNRSDNLVIPNEYGEPVEYKAVELDRDTGFEVEPGLELEMESEAYENGVEYDAPKNPDIDGGARINALSKTIVDKLAENSRKQRMPKGLNDARVLRAPFREEINIAKKSIEQLKASKAIKPESDSILDAIAKAGGINISELKSEGLDPADMGAKNKTQFQSPFTSEGKSVDQMAELLSQYGYLSQEYTKNELLDAISATLRGDDVYSSQVDYNQLLTQERFKAVSGEVKSLGHKNFSRAMDRALNGQSLGKREVRAVKAVMDILSAERSEYLGSVVRPMREKIKAARKYLGKSDLIDHNIDFKNNDLNQLQQDRAIATIAYQAIEDGLSEDLVTEAIEKSGGDPTYMGVLIDALLDGNSSVLTDNNESLESILGINNGRNKKNSSRNTQDSRALREGGREIDGQAVTNSEADSRRSGNETEASESLLTTYSEEDLAQKELDRKAKESKDQANQKAIDDKAQADNELSAFSLAGSNAKADQEAAQGQSDLLSSQPSAAQKEAGNYKKKHVRIHGLEISIENQAGSIRSGTDDQGNDWSNEIQHDYGDIKGTKGADGDAIDVFIGKNLTGTKVFVVNQTHENGEFDEHKVMIGFNAKDSAEKGYLKNYDQDWDNYSGVVETTIDEFKDWLKSGDHNQPFKPQELTIKAKPEIEKKAKSEWKYGSQAADPKLPFSEQVKVNIDLVMDYKMPDTPTNAKAPMAFGHPMWSGKELTDIYVSEYDQKKKLGKGGELSDFFLSSMVAAIKLDGGLKNPPYREGSKLEKSLTELLTTDWTISRTKDNSSDPYLKDEYTIKVGSPFNDYSIVIGDTKPEAWNSTIKSITDDITGEVIASGDRIQDSMKRLARHHSNKELLDGEQPIKSGAPSKRIDAIIKKGKARRAKADLKSGPVPPELQGEDLDFLTNEEKEELHNEKLRLPSNGSEAEAARQRNLKRVSDRRDAKKTEKLEDTGDVLWGAKKHSFSGDRYDSLEMEDLPLSKIWPAKEVDAIENKSVAAFVYAARSGIPPKPRHKHKLARWVKAIEDAMALSGLVASLDSKGEFDEFIQNMAKRSPAMGRFASKIELLTLIDKSYWGEIGDVEENPSSMTIKDGVESESPYVRVGINKRVRLFTGSKTVKDALLKINDALSESKTETKKIAFEIRGRKGLYYINKKGDKGYRKIATFETVKEARDFLNNEYEKVVELWEIIKAESNVSKADTRPKKSTPRTGRDHRKGKDISADEFKDTFGFRGVQFGNWVKQGSGEKDRQGFVNQAYDAFMDLADIIGIPVKALSLEGSLGIAFGSRGGSKFAAHFEPSTTVINLTKTNGAGSLAHEWFHALDDYLIKARKTTTRDVVGGHKMITDYASDMLPFGGKSIPEDHSFEYDGLGNLREEAVRAFGSLVGVLGNSGMNDRARTIDRSKSGKAYWGTTIEVAARSFENYIVSKMAQSGYDNDFLAAFSDPEQFQKKPELYPYHLPSEMAEVEAAFDNVFSALQVKETENGLAIYEDSTNYIGYERNKSKVQQSISEPEGDTFTQRDLFTESALSTESRSKSLQDTFLVSTKSETVREVKVGLTKITTPEEAAHVVSAFRNNAQETMLIIATDQDGEVLEIIRHTIGAKDSASVYIGELSGALLHVDGVKKYWLAHNHPSGSAKASDADFRVTQVINGLVDDAGVEFQGHVILSGGTRAVSFRDRASEKEIKIHPKPRRKTLPVTERVIAFRKNGSEPEISSPQAAVRSIEKIESENAILLVNDKNSPVGVVSLDGVNTSNLRNTEALPRIIKAIGKTNATGAIYKADSIEALRGLSNVTALMNAVDVRILDALFYHGDSYKSSREVGLQSHENGSNVFARLEDAPLKNISKKEDPEVGQIKNWVAKVEQELGDTIEVVNSYEDLPADLKGRLSKRGMSGRIRGLYANGKMYLVADKIIDKKMAVETALHEMLGHKGVMNYLGDSLGSTIKEIAKGLGKVKLGTIAKRYKLDLNTDKGLDEAVLEYIAHASETGKHPSLVQKLIGAFKKALRKAFPSTKLFQWSDLDILLLIDAARPKNPSDPGSSKGMDFLARLDDDPHMNDLDSKQKEFLDKVGAPTLTNRVRDTIKETLTNWRLKVRQGAVDRYAALLDMDKKIFGEDVVKRDIHHSSWVRATMSNVASGAMDSLMTGSRIKYDREDGVIDTQANTKGLMDVLSQLGSSNEVKRFMAWIAANRAQKLMSEGRENLFTEEEIEAAVELNNGMAENGESRGLLYARVFTEFQDIRDDVLSIAEAGGLLRHAVESHEAIMIMANEHKLSLDLVKKAKRLDKEISQMDDEMMREDLESKQGSIISQIQENLIDSLSEAEFEAELDMWTTSQRDLWSDEFYVPFYRVMEEDQQKQGAYAANSLGRQKTIKRLKGGEQNLNDLLENTLMNFHYLIDASMKNIAAQEALNNAQLAGVATQVKGVTSGDDITYILDGGRKVYFQVTDKLIFEAIGSLSAPVMNNVAMKAMRKFKTVFTAFTTSSPQFMIANLMRDSLHGLAVTGLNLNPLSNVYNGVKSYLNDENRSRMNATGGAFHFGQLHGENSEFIKWELDRKLRGSKIIDSPAGALGVVKSMWEHWQEIGNTLENANRAALFKKTEAESGTLAAAFESRDMMNFGAHGSWPAIRFLIDVVPFLNARIQGLDKMWRDGVKPTGNVLRDILGGKDSSASDKQIMQRFMAVVGAISVASMALFAHNYDDEEYKKLEDWKKDTYWIIRVGSNMFFIPKPFEVGAIGTMAERLTEQVLDKDATGGLFAERLGHMLGQTFSFDPTPQIVRPILDIYSNKDAFTGRDIETMSMQNLSPSMRTKANTTGFASGTSKALESTFGQDSMLTLSPVQIDHMIGGYLGWLGKTISSSADTAGRTLMGETQPEKSWFEYQPFRRFYKDLDNVGYTKYQTQFYDKLKEVSRVYADLREYRSLGEIEAARDLAKSNGDNLRLRKKLNKIRIRLTKINKRIKLMRVSNLDPGSKRAELDRLTSIKNRMVEAIKGHTK